MDILDQLNQQFEQDTKDDKPTTEKIDKEEVLKDNKETLEWLEKQKSFVLGNKREDDSEFLKKTDVKETSKTSRESKETKSSSYNRSSGSSSSSSGSTRYNSYSGYNSRTSSNTKSADEVAKEKAEEKAKVYSDAIAKKAVERATKKSKILSDSSTDWDIFEIHKAKKAKSRPVTKESKRIDMKISMCQTICSIGKTMVRSLQAARNLDKL